MVDEDIRTYWSAESGNEGEYVVIDLEEESLVNAIQINFAEQGTNLYGMSPETLSSIFFIILNRWKYLGGVN